MDFADYSAYSDFAQICHIATIYLLFPDASIACIYKYDAFWSYFDRATDAPALQVLFIVDT